MTPTFDEILIVAKKMRPKWFKDGVVQKPGSYGDGLQSNAIEDARVAIEAWERIRRS